MRRSLDIQLTVPKPHPAPCGTLVSTAASSNGELIARVDQLAAHGFRGITIGLDVWPAQLDAIVAEAKTKHLAILAEPGFTGYPYAIRSGVEALVHNDHYQMELAPGNAKFERAEGNGAKCL